MRPVYLVAMGRTPIAEHWDAGLLDLAARALNEAVAGLEQRPLDALYVASALSGALAGQQQLGAAVAAAAGLTGVEAWTIEAAEASGGMALRAAVQAVAGGAAEIVGVVGVDKATDRLEGPIEAALALGLHHELEAAHGLTRAGAWALLMRRYMQQYGYAATDLAAFPINAHANAGANPCAMYRFPIALERFQSAAPVAEPISLLDAPTVADGAAAVVLATEAVARELSAGQPLIRIAGSAAATDTLALTARRDLLWLTAVERATRQALAQAGIERDAVDVLEISDPHAISAVLALESAGLAERGSAPRLAADGAIRPDGALPLATGGGCKARGDAPGATGVYQIIELAQQLRGAAGAAQVADASTALALTIGGIGTTVAAHVLRREA